MAKKDSNNSLYGLALLLNEGVIQQKNILDFKNNSDITMYHLMMMFNKTNSMFEYGGDFKKEEYITKRWLESITQLKGYSCIHEFNGKLYCDWGLLGGVPRYDYLPSKLIVDNPYTKCNEQLEIDKDCVMFRNDSFGWGLYPLNLYYANKLKDNDQSRRVLMVTLRSMQMLYASDSDTAMAIQTAFKKLEAGELAAIFDDNALSEAGDTIKSLPFCSNTTSQTLIQLLEDLQYYKGSWWNEVGVQSNYNMKRETITSSENILNVDSLLPFSDNMLEARKECVEKVNKMFGRNWTVEFSSAWKKIRKEIAQKEEALEAEAMSKKLDNRKVKTVSNKLDDKDGDSNESN